MQILIIDDDPDFRRLIRRILSVELKNSEVTEYAAETLGRPGPDFDWRRFDVLLLDYQLGGGEDGLQWLEEFGHLPKFPPTVVLTAEGDEYVAVRAVKQGAADYINKRDISPGRLADMVRNAAKFNTPKVRTHQEGSVREATRILKDIRADQDAVPGRKLEIGYRVIREIGAGAMSRVYLSERISDGLTVVLKLLNLSQVEEPVLVKRFIQEAEVIAEINSPFIVHIYEYGMTDEYGFIVLEFFSRGDLKQRLELKLKPDMAFNYLTHIVYGLEAIHRAGVIHRDLKPANIMFRGDDTLALADFGISKRLHASKDITAIGQILGTPHYMSPEQGQARPVDARSDLYSAGVLLFEMLSGEKPFKARSAQALIMQHIHEPIPRLPPSLRMFQPIIERSLAKDPDQRYQTARELIMDLETAEQICLRDHYQ